MHAFVCLGKHLIIRRASRALSFARPSAFDVTCHISLSRVTKSCHVSHIAVTCYKQLSRVTYRCHVSQVAVTCRIQLSRITSSCHVSQIAVTCHESLSRIIYSLPRVTRHFILTCRHHLHCHIERAEKRPSWRQTMVMSTTYIITRNPIIIKQTYLNFS